VLCALLLLGWSVSPVLAQGRGTISGVVIGPAGTPQPNVTLIVTNSQGIDRRGVTGPDGGFVFGGLLAGPYRLRTDDETFAPFSQDQIAVTGGQTVALKIQLQPRVPVTAAPTQRATIQGTVINPTGGPAANIVVFITNADGIDRRVVTDQSGAYIFGGLQPGPYRLRIEDAGPGARPFPTAEITFAPGERRQFDIRLQPLPPPPPPVAPPPVAPRPAPAAPAPTAPETKAAKKEKNETKDKDVPQVAAVTAAGGEFEAMPNRWDFKYPVYQRYTDEKKMPWVVGGPFDPYNQNAAKGDIPIAGNSLFANVNLQMNSTVNSREVLQPGGATKEVFDIHNFVGGVEVFRGDTVFEPKRWAARATVVGNLNGTNGGPADGRRQTYGVEEAFVEKRLAVLDPSFDFVSVRGGMQNFNSDFRGYLFVDNQLGVRLFGNGGSNRYQYNVAYFDMRNRDIFSQLHRFSSRDQQVFIANYYIQDFGAEGYTAMFNVHLNRDDKVTGPDGKGQQVTYLGFHGDGRWGAWSVNHAFYQAFGTTPSNNVTKTLDPNSPQELSVNARMAAFELSRDADWKRYRFSAYYASGDNRSDPAKATGFDTITDNPNLAGGAFMFWTQQLFVPAIPPPPTPANPSAPPGNPTPPPAGGKLPPLKEKFSLLPNLRSKFADPSNFVNPGVMLVNAGVDFRLSPSMKLVTNASWLRYADATVLRTLAEKGKLAPGFEDDAIGIDLSVGTKYRPFVNENLFVVLGYSMLLPQGGFKTHVGSDSRLHSFVGAIQVAY